MVKNLQCLKTPQICYLRHAEHHAKNRTSLHGLDHDTLFFEVVENGNKLILPDKTGIRDVKNHTFSHCLCTISE